MKKIFFLCIAVLYITQVFSQNLKNSEAKALTLASSYGFTPTVVSKKPRQYYVDTSGSDRNSGSINKPFKTIKHALSKLSNDDTLTLRGGIFRESMIVNNDGILIRAYEGEHVVITGLDIINNWTKDKGQVYQSEVVIDPLLDFPQVFVNKQRVNPAAYPDLPEDLTNYALWGQSLETFPNGEVNFNSGKPDNYWTGGLALHISGASWQLNDGNILNSTSTQLICDSLNGREIQNSGKGKGMVIFHRNALDKENEFHYDKASSQVYLWQPEGGNPQENHVEVRTRYLGLDMNAKSNIQVEGITFYAAAVSMKNTNNCTLSNCNILYSTTVFKNSRNSNRYAVDLLDANDGLVTKCYIAHGWASGVRLHSIEKKRGMNLKVNQCVFENLGWGAPTEGAIYMYGTDKNFSITQNTIRNVGSEGVTGYGNPADISYNHFEACMNLSRDGGAIYLYGGGKYSSRSYNWIEHCYDYIQPINQYKNKANISVGIYTDGGADAHHVHHNVIWRCDEAIRHNNHPKKNDGLLWGIRTFNNTLWDISGHLMNNWSWEKFSDNITEQRAWNNLADDDTWLAKENMLHANLKDTSGTQFMDTTPDEFSDFRLKKRAAAINYGVVFEDSVSKQKLPLAKAWKEDSPDVGAYEYGANWTAGANVVPLANDEFESGNLKGGNGWISNWMISGNVKVSPTYYHGDKGLSLKGSDATDYAKRDIDLSHTKVGTLSFWWRGFGLNSSSEGLQIYIVDGDKKYTLRTIRPGEDAKTNGESWSEWRLETLDLSNFNFRNSVQTIVFDASGLNSSSEVFHLDDIQIYDYASAFKNK